MQGIDQPLPDVQRRRRGMRRTPLLIVLSVFMFVSGSLTLAFANAPTAAMPGTRGMNYELLSRSPSTGYHKVSPTVVPTSIIQHPAMPVLPPIVPFPLYMPQQLATLEANDRFFYHGNTNLPEVSLTFDDGPNPPYTSQVLAILQHYGITATFFDVGTPVQAYPDLVRQEYAADITWGTIPGDMPIFPLSLHQALYGN